MQWLIKNPAPTDERQQKWGDYHFGRSLTRALEQLGHSVTTDYYPDWQTDTQSDVVLVLRGKYPYQRQGANRDALHLMWNISHPADVSAEEYRDYDHVFVASEQHATTMAHLAPGRVHSLLQCTDTEQFHPRDDGNGEAVRRDMIFVGNTRSERRELVLAAAKASRAVKIWGRGWRNFELEDQVVADYIDNQQLGELYRSARLCINDHWPDMTEHGFINNRLFDALACGLPVLSDPHPATAGLFGQQAVVASTAKNAHHALSEMLLHYPAHLDSAAALAKRVQSEHSFSARAQALISTIT